MKRVLVAALLVSGGAYADKAAEVKQPAEAKVEENSHKNWPTLDEWFKTNNLNAGTLTAELLVGYEHSDLDNGPGGTKAANAFITRTRVNYQTANHEGFDARIQAQYVGPINDHYSYPGGGNGNYDVVADPENFRLHQAYLGYTGFDSKVKVGAQEIILDNARFIGNIGWRLNAQSFNAGAIQNNSIENLKLYYAYTESINTILGSINHERRYHLANAEYNLNENNKASAFAYLQRNTSSGAGPNKLDTFGLRTWGKNEALSHEATIALQRNALYGHVFGEINVDVANIGGGVEYISGGSSSHDIFQTLDGTAHKFNGWADQFAAGAASTGTGVLDGGLLDIYGQISATPVEKLKLMGVVHAFTTTDERANGWEGPYGYEIDALAKYPICKNFDMLAKVAYYIKDGDSTRNPTADETVFWLRGTLSF
jgi:hypothetical protein